MNHQEAVQKITKLLRLANSSNANEAAVAASKAQEIMDRYKIEALAAEYEDQEPEEEIRDFWDDPLEKGKNLVRWKAILAMTLGEVNACGIYRTNGDLKIIGRPSDVSTVRYLYNWLVRETNKLADFYTPGYGKTYSNNFRLGVIDTVSIMLRSQHKETVKELQLEASSGNALMVINRAIEKREKQAVAVKDFMNRKGFGKAKNWSRTTYDASARAKGREAGKKIKMTTAKASLEG